LFEEVMTLKFVLFEEIINSNLEEVIIRRVAFLEITGRIVLFSIAVLYEEIT
jgi:hypothetical protein